MSGTESSSDRQKVDEAAIAKVEDQQRKQRAKQVLMQALYDGRDDLRKQFEPRVQLRSLDKGVDLIIQDDVPDYVYVLLDGSLKVYLPNAEGAHIHLSTMEPGSIIGEMGVFDKKRRSASVGAVGRCYVAQIRIATFRSLMEANGLLATRIAQTVSDRLRDTNRRLYEATAYKLTGRVFNEMIRIAERSYPSLEGKESVKIELGPKKEFSDSLNSSREAVSRAVRQLIENGWVKPLDNKSKAYLIYLDEGYEPGDADRPRNFLGAI